MLLKSIKRVTAWHLHKLGHWLDPDDSYHYPELFSPGAEAKERVLCVVALKQPVPWANLLVLTGLPAIETRNAVTDLMDEGLVTTTSMGIIIVDKESDADH